VHLAVLLAAALVLPVRISGLLGPPDVRAPAPWLLGVLALSIGAPFAALSATAPLLQAWFARSQDPMRAGRTWSLYAASNLGSLTALLAYPVVIEPGLPLRGQSLAWTASYIAFAVLLASVAPGLNDRQPGAQDAAADDGVAPSWLDRTRWIALAAIPSSLLVGVTSFVSADIASAPFLWVIPLALYLLSFVIAFQDRPAVSREATLAVHAVALTGACALIHVRVGVFLLGAVLHFIAFFLTALVCAQALTAHRPRPRHLTDFYLCLAVGGVIGGGFNAFVAPLTFSTVAEYPAVLAISALARPWGEGRSGWRSWLVVAVCLACGLVAPELARPFGHAPHWVVALGARQSGQLAIVLIALTAIGALTLQERGPLFFLACAILVFGAGRAEDRVNVTHTWRDFFGVLRESELFSPALGGPVRMLANGTTLHGAQAVAGPFRCRPIVYYAPATPIGQVMAVEQRRPVLAVGVVGLGTGSMAAYVRPADSLRFFEIDPLVAKIASDRRRFSYIASCARGAVGITLGDARLTLTQTPARFDVLLIDAFSSDSVPAHLLTVEAMRLYLAHLAPGGLLVLHLSNRNLDLLHPAQAAVLAAGGTAMFQKHLADPRAPPLWESSEDAVIAARDPAVLAPFTLDLRWRKSDTGAVRAWTDDHIDVFGALTRRLAARWRGEPGA
ncbi:MAG: fused MFS/spermidine synthase, partial [Caulobacteraceae bacterium]|nr:fused MFS/spermidine synthase [Caulobacteraceae bacterium]